MNDNAPEHLEPKQKRDLRLKYAPYQLINDVLFRKNYDGVLLCCLEKDDAERVLEELHFGPSSGHFGGENTFHEVIHVSYYCKKCTCTSM